MYRVPDGFGWVEDGVYRAAKLDKLNYPFVEKLQLKTIVLLNPESPSLVLNKFAQSCNTNLVHIGFRPWATAAESIMFGKGIVVDGLKYLFDKRTYPLLLLDSTNTLIGVLRKIQKWTYAAILSEYKAFAGISSHYEIEVLLELIHVHCIPQEEVEIPRRQSRNLVRIVDEDDDDESSRQYHRPSHAITLVLPQAEVIPQWFLNQLEFEGKR